MISSRPLRGVTWKPGDGRVPRGRSAFALRAPGNPLVSRRRLGTFRRGGAATPHRLRVREPSPHMAPGRRSSPRFAGADAPLTPTRRASCRSRAAAARTTWRDTTFTGRRLPDKGSPTAGSRKCRNLQRTFSATCGNCPPRADFPHRRTVIRLRVGAGCLYPSGHVLDNHDPPADLRRHRRAAARPDHARRRKTGNSPILRRIPGSGTETPGPISVRRGRPPIRLRAAGRRPPPRRCAPRRPPRPPAAGRTDRPPVR